MMVNKKYKILLIQLPAPEFAFIKQWGNVPLAAGYLKAMAYKEGLLNEVDIEILGEKDTNLSSDSRLIDLIISKSPDMLGFSLYLWNSMRSMFISEEIKKKLPKTKIVIGGPEVTLETNYILDNPVVNIGCIGEGELTFIEIIKNIIKGKKNYANIKGIFYRKSGKIVVTPASEPIKDLNQIPSPFISGFIDPKDYQTISYEAIRGCPFKCSYCVTGLMPMKYFSADRICEDLKVILKSGKRDVRFVDSAFTFHPDFYEICERIKGINSEKKLCFTIFTYAEHINKKKASLLKGYNCNGIETGLQSIKSATLKNIQRLPLRKSKFIAGLKFLEKRKIHYSIDAMIGLPNETFQDFKKTLKFLRDNKVRRPDVFVLQVLPGTRLAREVKRYGIEYTNTPPYLITETDYISGNEIRKAITLATGRPKPSFSGSLVSYCNIQYPLSQKKNIRSLFKIKQLDNRINKVILKLDSSYQSTDQLEQAGKKLSRVIFQPFTVWFKTQNVEKDFALMKSFLLPIAASNPYLLWSIILETDNDFPISIIERIRRNIPSNEKLFDFCQTHDAIQTCIIFSWKNNKKKGLWLKDMSKLIPFFWSFNISHEPHWQIEIANLCREKYSLGILIDFDPKSMLDFIIEVLKFLYKKPRSKNIFFRNFSINYLMRFMVQKERFKDISIIKPRRKDIESILSLDKNMNISSVLTPSNETVTDLIDCQIEVLKSSKVREHVL